MEYEATDEDTIQPSGNMIPVALAVLGIILGTAGLYFGFNANKRLNSMDASIQESSTSSAEIEKAVTFFDTRIAELEEQLMEQSQLLNRLRAYGSQSEQKVKQLVGELNKNREQIVKITNQLNETQSSRTTMNATPKISGTQSTGASVSKTSSPARFGAERTYVIESGDTFAKIASKLGISLQAIIDANPDADPRRLAIGQKIVIPVE